MLSLEPTVYYASLISEIRALHGPGPIPLHRPVFEGAERRWLVECIDSNFVSSVGARVTEFEERVAAFTGAGFAVATVNGTAALHVALQLAGVAAETEVITQALTFAATCNAVRSAGAWPVFVDVDRDTLGLSPEALRRFLDCFGALHTGTFRLGRLATLSFNGNTNITTGGGRGKMILTDDRDLAARVKHLTATARIPHPCDFAHDEMGSAVPASQAGAFHIAGRSGESPLPCARGCDGS